MRIVCGLLFAWLVSARAGAQSIAADAGSRRDVVVGMVGEPDEGVREVLSPLLRAELSGVGLTLVERDPGGDLGQWAAAAARARATLLAVLLDTRGASGWRLVIIDAARDRAIARELSGGMAENAASVEAVVSIVVSAANALREGLEVASTPTQSVVGPPVAPAKPAPAPDRPRRPLEARPAETRAATTFVHGALAAGAASFSSETRATLGLSAALGATVHSALELRATVSRHLPAHVESPFGEFRIDRTLAALSAGPALSLGNLRLTPEAGAIVEWLERSETQAAPGVTGHDDRTLQRVGGLLSLRARQPLAQPLSLELRIGAAYFGQSVDFVAESATPRRLAEAWPMVLFAELGLAVSGE